MQRDLSGAQLVDEAVGPPLEALGLAAEHPGAVEGEALVLQGAGEVAPGHELHGGVVGIGVVDGQPHGDRLRRCERPVHGVLVERDLLAVAGELGEEVRTPADDLVTEDVAHEGGDARLRDDVPQPLAHVVVAVDRVRVALVPGRQHLAE